MIGDCIDAAAGSPWLSLEQDADGDLTLVVDTYSATSFSRGDWQASASEHPGNVCRIGLVRRDRAEWTTAYRFARWLLRVARMGLPTNAFGGWHA